MLTEALLIPLRFKLAEKGQMPVSVLSLNQEQGDGVALEQAGEVSLHFPALLVDSSIVNTVTSWSQQLCPLSAGNCLLQVFVAMSMSWLGSCQWNMDG